MNFGSVKFKIILIIFVCLTVGSMAINRLLSITYDNSMQLDFKEDVRMSKEIFYNLEFNKINLLTAELQLLLENDSVKKPFMKDDREKLYESILPLFNKFENRYGINYWSFIKPGAQGKYFLRVHEPEKFDDVIRSSTYDKAVLSNKLSYGKEFRERLVFWIVYPLFNKGQLIGFMELGEEIGHFLEVLRKQPGNEYGLLIDKSYIDERKWASMRAKKGLANNWNDIRDAVVVDKAADSAGLIKFEGSISDIPNEGIVFENLREKGRTFIRGAFPVYDVNNKKIGAVYVLHEVTQIYDQLKSLQSKVVIFLTTLSVVISSIIIIIFNNENEEELV